MNTGTAPVNIKKVSTASAVDIEDVLAIEEPLEIRMGYTGPDGKYTAKNISITMRTPGNDHELAVGFLFTEGIISSPEEVKSHFSIDENIIQINLKEEVQTELSKLERNFYTTSSCGVCGKSSIESVKTTCNLTPSDSDINISYDLLYQLPALLRQRQAMFEHTGGIHASALYNADGELIELREDVGRHNALDKLIGYALQNNLPPLSDHILLLSGRASFELIQKAAMAGIKVVAAVGAPSSLAVQTAKEFDMTLVGFLKQDRFNIYCGANRIIV